MMFRLRVGAASMILLMQLRLIFSHTDVTTFSYPSFSQDSANITLSGDASFSSRGGFIDLTVNDVTMDWSVGRAIYKHPVRLYDAATSSIADFESKFTFVIDSTMNKSYRADGLTFFLSPGGSTIPPNAKGQWLGLLNGDLDGNTTNQVIAVEFDTLQNDGDPSASHMGIDVNSVSSSKRTVNFEWPPSDQLNGEALISYNSTTRTILATMSSTSGTSSSILLEINLTRFLPEIVYVGFSASTGLFGELHRISSWNFRLSLTTPDPPPSHLPPTASPIHPPLSSAPKKPNNSKLMFVLVPCIVVVVLLIGCVPIVIASRRRKASRSHDGNLRIQKETILDKEHEDQEADDVVGITALFRTGPRRFSYADLAAATNFFGEEERLGEGGFGGVYRGELLPKPGEINGQIVAVKRLSKGSSQGIKEYISEVTVISHLRHRNLVPLIGWCHERSEWLLVYEYMEGGSLDSHLFPPKSSESTKICAAAQVLPWELRMRVALDIASALLYLHDEWVQCVIHRDIKTSNVMIDSSFNARLGDFGLARLVDHGYAPETKMMAGTFGYIAPECLITGMVSKESDVYSFGVVLLEIACGRRAILSQPVGEEQAGVSRLVEWVWGRYCADKLLDAIDGRLAPVFDREEAECMMMVGLWCALPDKESRPTIREAIQTLRFQAKLPELPPKLPANLVFTYADPTTTESGATLTSATTAGSNSSATATSVPAAGSSTKEWSMEASMLVKLGETRQEKNLKKAR